jgi:hypothetical protein
MPVVVSTRACVCVYNICGCACVCVCVCASISLHPNLFSNLVCVVLVVCWSLHLSHLSLHRTLSPTITHLPSPTQNRDPAFLLISQLKAMLGSVAEELISYRSNPSNTPAENGGNVLNEPLSMELLRSLVTNRGSAAVGSALPAAAFNSSGYNNSNSDNGNDNDSASNGNASRKPSAASLPLQAQATERRPNTAPDPSYNKAKRSVVGAVAAFKGGVMSVPMEVHNQQVKDLKAEHKDALSSLKRRLADADSEVVKLVAQVRTLLG